MSGTIFPAGIQAGIIVPRTGFVQDEVTSTNTCHILPPRCMQCVAHFCTDCVTMPKIICIGNVDGIGRKRRRRGIFYYAPWYHRAQPARMSWFIDSYTKNITRMTTQQREYVLEANRMKRIGKNESQQQGKHVFCWNSSLRRIKRNSARYLPQNTRF